MKPRTVYEKALQDFTETAQRLAGLNQHFLQASFAEFEMLMVDDEVLKRYGLPKPMVKRALIEVYETVVLDQQRYRDRSSSGWHLGIFAGPADCHKRARRPQREHGYLFRRHARQRV